MSKTITAEDFDKAVPQVCAKMTMDAIMSGDLTGEQTALIGLISIQFASELRTALFDEPEEETEESDNEA